jgi:hypothetical protein
VRRLGATTLTATFAVGLGLCPVNARVPAAPPANFGAPPTGEIPVLFNDRHIYTKPDRLRQNRVLAALIRGTTILVPLRSMFEQTGATVSYDSTTKTVDVSKPGSDVKVTVGRPEVIINGESRPLDVPPEMDKGTVEVPLRVISEGMGAYVQWVPERRTVVVRYIAAPAPPPPPPSPEPTQAPAPLPSATPTSPPARKPTHERFLVGDYLFTPKVYNEFSPGNKGVGFSYSARGAIEFGLLGLPWMLEGDFRSYRYPHTSSGPFGLPPDPGFVTVIGGYGQTNVASFTAKETDLDGRFGLKIADPRIYIGIGYVHLENRYGYPKQSGIGFGVEKLPDLDQRVSLYGSLYDYPNVTGNFAYPQDLHTCPPGGTTACAAGSLFGTSGKLTDRYLKYRIGLTLVLTGPKHRYGAFVDGGYVGDSIHGKSLAPASGSHAGPYAGLGLKF